MITDPQDSPLPSSSRVGFTGATLSRKRSRWPRRIGVALAILVLLPPLASLALHLYGRARFASAVSKLEALVGEPLVLDLAQLRTTPPPKQLNIAAWLTEGARSLEPWSEEEIAWKGEARRLPRDVWRPQLEAGVRSMVQRRREALEILHQAAPLVLCDYEIPYDEVTESYLFDYLLKLLPAAELLHLEARLAFGEGDTAAGLLATQTLARLASSLARERHMIHSVFGLAYEKYLPRVVREVLESTEPWAASPALLEQLEALLPAADLMASAREALISEVVSLSVRMIRDGLRQEPGRPPLLGWAARYQLSSLMAAELLDDARRVVELIPVPYAEARARLGSLPEYGAVLPEIGPRMLDILTNARSDHVQLNELVSRYILALFSEQSPAMWKYNSTLLDMVYRHQRAASQRQLMRAAVAMRRIGIAAGAYPSQRPALAVLDRPDPFAGRPVAYRLRADGSLGLEIEDSRELTRQLFPRAHARFVEPDVFSTILPPPLQESEAVSSRDRKMHLHLETRLRAEPLYMAEPAFVRRPVGARPSPRRRMSSARQATAAAPPDGSRVREWWPSGR